MYQKSNGQKLGGYLYIKIKSCLQVNKKKLTFRFKPFGYIATKTLVSTLLILSVSDEDYSRYMLCTLNLITTFS